jgi:crossover junction endodeoxyribonuclease RusA
MSWYRWEFLLTWAELPLSANKHTHHMVVARHRKEIRREVQVRARAAKLPTGLGRVHIILHWAPKDKRRRDTDNMNPSLKPVIDGLVDYGLVPDDNSHHVTSSCEIHEPMPRTDRYGHQVTQNVFWVSIEHVDRQVESLDNEQAGV